MLPLDALTREASALAANETRQLSKAEHEAVRVLRICNACRYCEGFCAVFPAMARRLEFGSADVHFLANLCHNCGACLHACQYAPPHEFAVNVPRAMAEARLQTWIRYAWPSRFGVLYSRNGLTIALALAGGFALFLLLAAAWAPLLPSSAKPTASNSSFYAVFPHALLTWLFGAVFAFSTTALGVAVRRFWRREPPGEVSVDALREAVHDVLTLRYLGGGHGEGCNERDDAFSLARRRFHHLTFYGFMLCFASTCVATLYHYVLRSEAPYAWSSPPVVLGTSGGVSMLIGAARLLWLNFRRHELHGLPTQRSMDRGFISLLLLTSASGLLLLVLRGTLAMPALLAIHLGTVMALFLTLPYGKFAHGVYRSAALLRWAMEKRQPSP